MLTRARAKDEEDVMTMSCGRLRTAIIAAAIAWIPAIAASQTAPPIHDHGSKAGAALRADIIAAKLMSLDARIAMLTADMKMFVGEMKIQTMEMLIEALVERQTLMDGEMRRRHEEMRGPANNRRPHALPPGELEPETLCSPFI
jgi:hypothetical protein